MSSVSGWRPAEGTAADTHAARAAAAQSEEQDPQSTVECGSSASAPHSHAAGHCQHRQRAEAAVTSAPSRATQSGPSARSQPETSKSASQQSDAKTGNDGSCSPPPAEGNAASAPLSADRPDSTSSIDDSRTVLSATQHQLESKLSALTDRLRTAEQAASTHTVLQQQLLELKQDKDAIQADMRQFTEHISSMLTTLQSQVSRLLLSNSVEPHQHQASAAMHSAAGKQTGQQGSLGTAHLQWNVESHGSVPSPLARHQIFQSNWQPTDSHPVDRQPPFLADHSAAVLSDLQSTALHIARRQPGRPADDPAVGLGPDRSASTTQSLEGSWQQPSGLGCQSSWNDELNALQQVINSAGLSPQRGCTQSQQKLSAVVVCLTLSIAVSAFAHQVPH